jgi:hypothetical protein
MAPEAPQYQPTAPMATMELLAGIPRSLGQQRLAALMAVLVDLALALRGQLYLIRVFLAYRLQLALLAVLAGLLLEQLAMGLFLRFQQAEVEAADSIL